jgi:hypothetical protein
MASKTRATELKRLRRDKRMGTGRKAKNRNHGTTKSASELFGDEKKK